MKKARTALAELEQAWANRPSACRPVVTVQ